MNKRVCPECGAQLVRKSVKAVVQVGTRKVDDASVRAVACEACDYYELSQKQLEEMERKAAVVVLKEVEHISGAELKFARKAMGLRQTDLARALDVKPETVCRYEASDSIDRATQLAMAQLLTLHGTEPERFELLTMEEVKKQRVV